jgi:hypothetical protein
MVYSAETWMYRDVAGATKQQSPCEACSEGGNAPFDQVILLQDRARSFAGSASNDEKFNFYMAATGFDVMMKQLAASEAEVQQMIEKYTELNNLLEVRMKG